MHLILKENKLQQDREINKIKTLIPNFQKIINHCKENTSYTLSIEDMKSLMFNYELAIETLKEKLSSFMDTKLDILKTAPGLITANIKAGLNNIVVQIAIELSKLGQCPGIEYIDLLEIVNSKIVLPEDKEEEIRESFRSIVRSEAGKELFDLHKEMAESLSSFYSHMNSNTTLTFFQFTHMAYRLFELNEKTGKIDPSDVDYDLITKIIK